MTTLLAILEFGDYTVIAFIVLVFSASASFAARQRLDLRRLERKLDALLKHLGIEEPPGIVLTSGRPMSVDAQVLARDPSQRIAAIQLHREQNPGLGLAEAKADVEAFVAGGK
jgi:hypothetical protein